MHKNRNILLVEDDINTYKVIEKYLREFGFNIAGPVTTGEDAIAKSRDLKPDLVIMDIVLDGSMDGIDSSEYIYNHYKIPVIFLTNASIDNNLERIRKINPFGYLIKPINKNELKASIELALLKFSMEKKLIESEERYATILNSISDAVIVTDQDSDITYMNPVAEKLTGYDLNTVQGKQFDKLIIFEKYQNENDGENQSIENSPEKISLIIPNGLKLPVDYRISIQKDNSGSNIGNVIVFRDISESIKSEDKLRESLKMLRHAMGGIIQAIAYTVEQKDPYTAGHQRKVANIARLIAKKMDLSYDKIDGIRMAGVIHDLGKISVPAEILSKPGKITDPEFNLIKSHPQIGYDILKNIDFPWPIAEIVYQHHERLDGSGYPRGLSGDSIIIESRIIAVADVIEAMASHRPYRPSMGIDMALDEISKHQGLLYDKDVVDTCLMIFRDEGYTIDDL